MRAAPRDAVLADVTPPEDLGRAFGFQRAMDHAGAVVGPLIASGVLLAADLPLRVRAVRGARAAQRGRARARGARAPRALRSAARPRPAAVGGGAAARTPPLPAGARAVHARQLLRRVPPPARAGGGRGAGGHPAPVDRAPCREVRDQHACGRALRPHRPAARDTAGWMVYALFYAGFALASAPGTCGCCSGLRALPRADGRAGARAGGGAGAGGAWRGFGLYYAVTGGMLLPASLLTGMLWQAYGAPAALLTGAALRPGRRPPVAVGGGQRTGVRRLSGLRAGAWNRRWLDLGRFFGGRGRCGRRRHGCCRTR